MFFTVKYSVVCLKISKKELEELHNEKIGKNTSHVFVYRYPDSNDMPSMDGKEFIEDLEKVREKDREAAFYIHIPYCTKICNYCHYFKQGLGEEKEVEGYLEAVGKEIAGYRNLFTGKIEGKAVLFGGGTPTCLKAEKLNGIMGLLREMFPMAKETETTIESSPETLELEKLCELRQEFNRISIGVQDFNDSVLKECNRNHGKEQAINAIKDARNAGFENVNIDLIYGLPKQGIKGWEESLNEVENILPESVTASDLRIQEGTVFYSRGKKMFAAEEELVEMHSMFVEKMLSLGYEQLFPYQFVKKGKGMKFLENQWSNGEFLGFGASSCSYINSWDYNNVFPTEKYTKAIEETGFGFAVGKKLNAKEQIKRKVALGLKLCQKGIDKSEFKKEFGVSLEEEFGKTIETLQNLGLIESNEQALKLTGKGILFYDSVSRKFFE